MNDYRTDKLKITAAVLAFWLIFVLCGTTYGLGISKAMPVQKIASKDILLKLENNSNIIYDNVEIDGDLNFSNSNQTQSGHFINSKINITKIISITNSIFTGKISLKNCNLLDGANFKGSDFRGLADFSNSRFSKKANFLGCDFEIGCDFSGAVFLNQLVFKNAIFGGDVTFENSVQQDTSLFYNSSFKEKANMRNSTYLTDVYFTYAKFNDSVDFSRAKLRKADFMSSRFIGDPILLLNATFYDGTSFGGTTFRKEPIFYGSEFLGNTKFDQTQFDEGASFKVDTFDGNVIFDESVFAKDAKFNGALFNGTVGFNASQFNANALFDGAKFKGRLYLKGAKYDKLYVRWSDLHDLDYDDSAYLLIIENFKKLGFFSDADECYYHYRNTGRQYLPLQYRPVDFLLMALYGYGTKPEFPLGWSVFFIIACGLFFYATNGVQKGLSGSDGGRGENDQSMRGSQENQGPQRLSLWEAINFSATAFTSGASAFISYPPGFKPVSKSSYLVTLERIFGWVLFTLFLTALARTVIR
ncbi:Pentapeptide repeats (9 copies) [uncultured archaeon]|nr:Pentapeptide repeats (9 copies) [uncultured archaeon]